MRRNVWAAAAIGLGLAFATSASAVVQTSATFSAVGGDNLRYVNSGDAPDRLNDATLYTTSTATGTELGSALVNFSFVNSGLSAFVTDVNALMTINAVIAKNSAPLTTGSFFRQPGLSGSFSFTTTSAILVSGPGFISTFYAAGSNLLSGTFGGGNLVGDLGGTVGAGFAGTNDGGGVTFTSDFLDFSATTDRALSFSLANVSPAFVLGAGDNKALGDFRTTLGGQFASDGAPTISSLAAAVPEPATWGLMVVGFGLLGGSLRRRRKTALPA